MVLAHLPPQTTKLVEQGLSFFRYGYITYVLIEIFCIPFHSQILIKFAFVGVLWHEHPLKIFKKPLLFQLSDTSFLYRQNTIGHVVVQLLLHDAKLGKYLLVVLFKVFQEVWPIQDGVQLVEFVNLFPQGLVFFV